MPSASARLRTGSRSSRRPASEPAREERALGVSSCVPRDVCCCPCERAGQRASGRANDEGRKACRIWLCAVHACSWAAFLAGGRQGRGREYGRIGTALGGRGRRGRGRDGALQSGKRERRGVGQGKGGMGPEEEGYMGGWRDSVEKRLHDDVGGCLHLARAGVFAVDERARRVASRASVAAAGVVAVVAVGVAAVAVRVGVAAVAVGVRVRLGGCVLRQDRVLCARRERSRQRSAGRVRAQRGEGKQKRTMSESQ